MDKENVVRKISKGPMNSEEERLYDPCIAVAGPSTGLHLKHLTVQGLYKIIIC